MVAQGLGHGDEGAGFVEVVDGFATRAVGLRGAAFPSQRVVGVVDAQLAVFKAHQAVEQAATVGGCTNRYALLGTSTSKLIVKERRCSSCKYKVPLVVIYTSNEGSKYIFASATAFLSFSMSPLGSLNLLISSVFLSISRIFGTLHQSVITF